jgi:hypothetical protein
VLLPETITATIEAVAEAAVPRPFVVQVSTDRDGTPRGWVGSADLLERVVRTGGDVEVALRLLREVTPPEGADLDLRARLSEEALAAGREMNDLARRARRDHSLREQASRELDSLAEGLVVALNRHPWAQTLGTDPLVLVTIGGPFDGFVDVYARAAAVVGTERVARFRAGSPAAGSVPVPPGRLPPDDRAGFARLLDTRGLGAHVDRLFDTVATVGFQLRQAPAGSVNSRLGGPALLPATGSLPRTDDGEALSFLAGIDLAELTYDSPSPSSGWLLFYAATDGHEVELSEGAPNRDRSAARVFFTEGPPEAQGDSGSRVRHVRAVPTLTLPDWPGAGVAILGDPVEGAAYDELARSLRDPYGEDANFLLGAYTDDQAGPPDGHRSLLLLSADPELGWHFVNDGTLQFWMPIDEPLPAALKSCLAIAPSA